MNRKLYLIIGLSLIAIGIIGLYTIMNRRDYFRMGSFMVGSGMMRGMMGRGMMEEMMRNMEEIDRKREFSSNGERIYYNGINSRGEVIKNSHGMQGIGCAMCHGADAMGMRMMTMDVPAVKWDTLVDPKGHIHPDGRRHPPFSDASFKVCVLAGVDPAGNSLSTMMPKWQISDEDLDDLIGYLKTKP